MAKNIASLLRRETGGWSQIWAALVQRAPVLLAIFANIVILSADARVYDYLFTQTGSWWKALLGLLGCAIPFFLWEIGWGYNNTTEGWRRVSLAMAGLAFFTSILVGIADYIGWIGAAWGNMLVAFVVVEIGLHSVVGLLYYYNDPDVARRRHRAQTLSRMENEKLNAQEANNLLRTGQSLLTQIAALEAQYGIEDVETVIALLRGDRVTGKGKPAQRPLPAPTPVPAAATASDDGKGNKKEPSYHPVPAGKKDEVFTNRAR